MLESDLQAQKDCDKGYQRECQHVNRLCHFEIKKLKYYVIRMKWKREIEIHSEYKVLGDPGKD